MGADSAPGLQLCLLAAATRAGEVQPGRHLPLLLQPGRARCRSRLAPSQVCSRLAACTQRSAFCSRSVPGSRRRSARAWPAGGCGAAVALRWHRLRCWPDRQTQSPQAGTRGRARVSRPPCAEPCPPCSSPVPVQQPVRQSQQAEAGAGLCQQLCATRCAAIARPPEAARATRPALGAGHRPDIGVDPGWQVSGDGDVQVAHLAERLEQRSAGIARRQPYQPGAEQSFGAAPAPPGHACLVHQRRSSAFSRPARLRVNCSSMPLMVCCAAASGEELDSQMHRAPRVPVRAVGPAPGDSHARPCWRRRAARRRWRHRVAPAEQCLGMPAVAVRVRAQHVAAAGRQRRFRRYRARPRSGCHRPAAQPGGATAAGVEAGLQLGEQLCLSGRSPAMAWASSAAWSSLPLATSDPHCRARFRPPWGHAGGLKVWIHRSPVAGLVVLWPGPGLT